MSVKTDGRKCRGQGRGRGANERERRGVGGAEVGVGCESLGGNVRTRRKIGAETVGGERGGRKLQEDETGNIRAHVLSSAYPFPSYF